MTKKSSSNPCQLSTSSQLQRRPIHGKENISEESSIEEDENKKSPQKELLYPDLSQELEESNIKPKKKSHSAGEMKKGSNVLKQPVYEKYSLYRYLWIFLIILISLTCIYFIPSYSKFSSKSDLPAEMNVKDLIEDMKKQFKEQKPETFRLLRLALNKVVNVKNEPAAPAIITLIADKRAETTASQFSEYLANALAPGKYVSINESTYLHSSPSDLKLKIDKEINSKLEKNTLNVIIVDKLHNMPFEAAMIFHGYCDHEFAQYKRAVYLFIVPLNESIPETASTKYIDTVAMKQLRKIWHRTTDNAVDSLITRITVNVVNIK